MCSSEDTQVSFLNILCRQAGGVNRKYLLVVLWVLNFLALYESKVTFHGIQCYFSNIHLAMCHVDSIK